MKDKNSKPKKYKYGYSQRLEAFVISVKTVIGYKKIFVSKWAGEYNNKLNELGL